VFDLQHDPAESKNLVVTRPRLRARLARMIDDWDASRNVTASAPASR
jgi:hypothetical protein